ncbi:cobalamin adenosyltransferase [Peptococcaceae bacterium 1198_IL3148]
MKFITEMELRDLYKREPFTSYVLEPDARITPGARQFLMDRRVTLVQAPIGDGQKTNTNQAHQVQGQRNHCTLRLRRTMDRIESLFLLVAAEILRGGDVVLSQQVMALGKCFRNVGQAERKQHPPEDIEFWGWSEEEIKRRTHHLEEYDDINEFHVGLKNGKEITLLNYLRASLREVEPAILEVYWQEEQQACSRQELIDKVNLIINILCMMMWKCLGGQK